jgi:hypothetical protein
MNKMFGIALRTGSMDFIAEVLNHTLTAGWNDFVVSLQNAAPEIVDVFGPEAVNKIYEAVISAVRLVDEKNSIGADYQLDGVRISELNIT